MARNYWAVWGMQVAHHWFGWGTTPDFFLVFFYTKNSFFCSVFLQPSFLISAFLYYSLKTLLLLCLFCLTFLLSLFVFLFMCLFYRFRTVSFCLSVDVSLKSCSYFLCFSFCLCLFCLFLLYLFFLFLPLLPILTCSVCLSVYVSL